MQLISSRPGTVYYTIELSNEELNTILNWHNTWFLLRTSQVRYVESDPLFKELMEKCKYAADQD